MARLAIAANEWIFRALEYGDVVDVLIDGVTERRVQHGSIPFHDNALSMMREAYGGEAACYQPEYPTRNGAARVEASIAPVDLVRGGPPLSEMWELTLEDWPEDNREKPETYPHVELQLRRHRKAYAKQPLRPRNVKEHVRALLFDRLRVVTEPRPVTDA